MASEKKVFLSAAGSHFKRLHLSGSKNCLLPTFNCPQCDGEHLNVGAAANPRGQHDPGGIWQCQDHQERQLVPVRPLHAGAFHLPILHRLSWVGLQMIFAGLLRPGFQDCRLRDPGESNIQSGYQPKNIQSGCQPKNVPEGFQHVQQMSSKSQN